MKFELELFMLNQLIMLDLKNKFEHLLPKPPTKAGILNLLKFLIGMDYIFIPFSKGISHV